MHTCDLDCEGPQCLLAGDLHKLTKTLSSYLTQLSRGPLHGLASFTHTMLFCSGSQ